ncbi:MAG: PTS sugar transporter subunit IIC [Candidatus Eremiobacteraeota bacterium]|nr:PTS sugar transporter subunit IIC [Candidatus Eremiobacteraeota bacterium]
MLAIRDALPWSLIGLGAGLGLFFLASFHDGPAMPFAKRYAAALLPGFGLMSVTLAAILPFKLGLRLRLNPALLVGMTMAAFFLSPPTARIVDFTTYLRAIGASGLFLAIVIALAAAGLCLLLQTTLRQAQGGKIAAVIIVGGAWFAFTHHLSLSDAVLAMLRPLAFLGDTYLALILITVVETLLWTGGVHGPALLAGIITPVYLVLQQQNTAAYYDHAPLPHIVVTSLFLFVFPGGAGATLPLVGMLLFSRVERLRKVARYTLLPSIFNINEPLLFGLPIALNPFLAVPFVVAPAVLATVTFAAVKWGLVSAPAFYYPSSIPSLLSTYLATLDWRAVLLVSVNIAIAGAIYFPFLRAYERHEMQA